MTENVVWQGLSVTKERRYEVTGHKACILWFTGLSGSGKSTLANAVEESLHREGRLTYLLDGDNIRHGLNRDLGFSTEDRMENIRRIGEVARLFCDAGLIVLTSFISPFQKDRDQVRSLVERGEFVEIFVTCSLDTCEKRDPKGMYKKARAGEIREFTGIDSPYEEPENPEIVINTEEQTVEDSLDKIITYLKERGIIG
ncbi:MAG: adenylyl-sulfate kinase [bacterium]|nr:adenylyl-sulfate kinase [bacterium]